MSVAADKTNYFAEQLSMLSQVVDLAKTYDKITKQTNIAIDDSLIQDAFNPIVANISREDEKIKINNIISKFPKQIFIQPAQPELDMYYDKILDINEIIDDIDDSIFSKNFQTEILPLLQGLPNAINIITLRTSLIDLLEYSKKTGDIDSETLNEISNVFNEINTAFQPIYNKLNLSPDTAAPNLEQPELSYLEDIKDETFTNIKKRIDSILSNYPTIKTPFSDYFINGIDIETFKDVDKKIKNKFFDTSHISGIIEKIPVGGTFAQLSTISSPGGPGQGGPGQGGPGQGGPGQGGGALEPIIHSEGLITGGSKRSYKKTIKQHSYSKSKSHTMRNKYKRK